MKDFVNNKKAIKTFRNEKTGIGDENERLLSDGNNSFIDNFRGSMSF